MTGGATGIGRSIGVRFAAEGAQVVIADINTAAGAEAALAAGGLFVPCDVGQPEQAQAAVARSVAEYGGLDILVNCAAHMGGYHDVATMPATEWRAVLNITLDGVFYCSKYAAAAMQVRGGGSIIHIASVEGMMGVAGHAAYVTAKSALFGLTKSMAIDFGKQNIRVNTISPGIIDSGRPDIEQLKQDPVYLQWWRAMTVLDRLGRPEEVAAVALFFASDEAAYVTGQNLAVDGGWTIGHPPLPP